MRRDRAEKKTRLILTLHSGPNLPYEVSHTSSVQYGDTFALVGGLGSDRVLPYDPVQEGWTPVDGLLSEQKSEPIAFLVSEDIFPEC